MSVITYNTVQLPYSNTTSFEQKSVYDPSGTDRILTRFDIQTTCLVSSTYAAQLAPALVAATQSAADFMAWLRPLLLASKKSLSVKINGVELIPQPQSGLSGVTDAKNGPQPQYCQIFALSDTLFLVNYRIVAHYWENYNSIQNSSPIVNSNQSSGNVLYNRWRETITIDDRQFTKRVRRGRFQIRSDNVGKFIPDQLRNQMAVLGIPTGFLREKSEYTVTEDGLGLEYSHEDKEVHKLPPLPAYKADGSMRLQTSKNSTAMVTCQVRLQGSNYKLNNNNWDNQKLLAEKAIAIVTAKLANINFSYIQQATLETSLYDNEVSFSCSVFAAKSKFIMPTYSPNSATVNLNGTGGLDFFYSAIKDDNYTRTPFSDPFSVNATAINTTNGIITIPYSVPVDPPPYYYLRGTAALLLEAASFYDPSLKGVVVKEQTGGPTYSNITFSPQTGGTPAQLTSSSQILPMPGQTG